MIRQKTPWQVEPRSRSQAWAFSASRPLAGRALRSAALLLAALAPLPATAERYEPEAVPLEITVNEVKRVCGRVDARKSWQRFNLWQRDGVNQSDYHNQLMVSSDQPGWSVDADDFSQVGVQGYQGREAQKLFPHQDRKLHRAYPFGALMVRVDGRHVYGIQNPASYDISDMSEDGFASFVDFQINESHEALADNAGALLVCMNTTH